MSWANYLRFDDLGNIQIDWIRHIRPGKACWDHYKDFNLTKIQGYNSELKMCV